MSHLKNKLCNPNSTLKKSLKILSFQSSVCLNLNFIYSFLPPLFPRATTRGSISYFQSCKNIQQKNMDPRIKSEEIEKEKSCQYKKTNFKLVLCSFTFFISILLHNTTTKLEAGHNFTIIPVKDLTAKYPNITYQKCFDALPFEYEPFSLSINPNGHPCSGTFLESFVLTIPNGKVQSENGWTPIDRFYVKELIWKTQEWHLRSVKTIDKSNIQKVRGRVAVISQPCYFQYFHWMTEVLCRLALLELCNIEYDYLYVTNHSSFMKETLQLWGIPTEKIISPKGDNFCIQADQLIVPSLASTSDLGMSLFSSYVQPHLLKYVRNKLMSKALLQKPTLELHDKIFISRKDAPQRKILNEDAVFKVFEAQGFKRYSLTGMPVVDQIQLFHYAKTIVGPQGTSIANCMFCETTTRVIELFQGLNDATFWYISQILPLNYTPIKTTNFIQDYSAAWSSDSIMPLPVIKELAESL